MTGVLAGLRTYELYVDGQYRPTTGGSYEIINPSTETPVGLAPEASTEDLNEAVAAAKKAAPQWAALPAASRARLVATLADRSEAERDSLPILLASEMGGTATESAGNTIDVGINAFRAMADLGTKGNNEAFTSRQGMRSGLLFGVTHRKPVGVVAVITDYNAPLVNVSTMAGPALVAGNSRVPDRKCHHCCRYPLEPGHTAARRYWPDKCPFRVGH